MAAASTSCKSLIVCAEFRASRYDLDVRVAYSAVPHVWIDAPDDPNTIYSAYYHVTWMHALAWLSKFWPATNCITFGSNCSLWSSFC